jgi:hypothetical protein
MARGTERARFPAPSKFASEARDYDYVHSLAGVLVGVAIVPPGPFTNATQPPTVEETQ